MDRNFNDKRDSDLDTALEKFENEQLNSTVRPTVCTNPSRKRSFLKTIFKPKAFENADFAFYFWRKHSLKKELNNET